MKALWIDFVQPWPLHVRLLRYGLLAGGILMLGLVFMQHRQLDQARTALAWRLQDLQGQVQAPERPRAEISDVDQQAVKRAQDVLHSLDLPWHALFDTLESAIANNIVILGVEPNAQNRRLTLTAVATDSEAAIDFADRLKASGRLRNIHLTQEDRWEDNPRFPLQFLLSADWGGTP